MKALSYLVKIRTGTGSADGEQIVRINVPVIVAIQVLKKLLCVPRLRFVEEHCRMLSNETEESSSKKKRYKVSPGSAKLNVAPENHGLHGNFTRPKLTLPPSS